MGLRHLAIIPDGNRRWAKQHRVNVMAGYKAGADRMLEVVGWCLKHRIPHLSGFILSKDNTRKRPDEEIVAIREATLYFLREIDRLKLNIRLCGDVRDQHRLWNQEAFSSLDCTDRRKAPLTFWGMVNHSRTDDLGFDFPYQHWAVPDVDLLIRTGDRQRLDGFMPMQIAYSEILFLSKMWPNFTVRDMDKALAWYRSRKRTQGE